MSIVGKTIRKEIIETDAYQVASSPKTIKLDAMENPYCLSNRHKLEWLEHLKHSELNRYPDPKASSIVDDLASSMQVPNDMQLMLGNGSDELIQIISMALKSDAVIMAPAPSFAMYQIIAKFTKTKFISVPLTANFQLDQEQFLQAIKKHQPAVIFIANPNNPTGNLFERKTIETIIKSSTGLVVVDEAYQSFASDSFMADLKKYSNLLIMRTVSKMGLAGIRLGILAGAKTWLNQFDKVRLPYNINTLTQKTIEFILQNPEILQEQTEAIITSRGELFAKMQNLSEITVFKSEANFILFKVANAEVVFAKLLENGILIKKLHGSHPSLTNYLRVTVGTEAENLQFINNLRALV